MRLTHGILCLILLLAPLTATAQHIVLVKAQTLTLRAKASKTSAALDTLVTFQPVEALKVEGDWSQVKTTQGKTGYVLTTYLTRAAFVYSGETKINGRYGPGMQYDVILEYTQPAMPLRVIDIANDDWLMVMDYEGDRSWTHRTNVKITGDTVITKLPNNNIRKGVGTDAELAFTAQKGVIFKVLEEKDGWLHVKHEDGDEGWLSAKLVFGWLDEPVPGAKTDNPKTTTSTAEKTTGTSKAGSSKAAETPAPKTSSKSGSGSSKTKSGTSSSKSKTGSSKSKKSKR